VTTLVEQQRASFAHDLAGASVILKASLDQTMRRNRWGATFAAISAALAVVRMVSGLMESDGHADGVADHCSPRTLLASSIAWEAW
jgi:hypothetical protein